MDVFYIGGPMDGKRVAPYHCDLDHIEVEVPLDDQRCTRTLYRKRLFVAPGISDVLGFVHQDTPDTAAMRKVSELYYPHSRAARSSALKLA